MLRVEEARTAPKFIHLIRDPVEMIVSAYLYHLKKPSDEMWWLTAPGLFEPTKSVFAALIRARCKPSSAKWSWLEILECLPQKEGIVAEGWKMISGDIEPMAEVRSQFDCLHPSSAFVLDIDEVDRDFMGSMVRLLKFLNVTEEKDHRVLLEALAITQIASLSNASSSHVTNGNSEKARLRRILKEDPEIAHRLLNIQSKSTCLSVF